MFFRRSIKIDVMVLGTRDLESKESSELNLKAGLGMILVT